MQAVGSLASKCAAHQCRTDELRSAGPHMRSEKVLTGVRHVPMRPSSAAAEDRLCRPRAQVYDLRVDAAWAQGLPPLNIARSGAASHPSSRRKSEATAAPLVRKHPIRAVCYAASCRAHMGYDGCVCRPSKLV